MTVMDFWVTYVSQMTISCHFIFMTVFISNRWLHDYTITVPALHKAAYLFYGLRMSMCVSESLRVSVYTYVCVCTCVSAFCVCVLFGLIIKENWPRKHARPGGHCHKPDHLICVSVEQALNHITSLVTHEWTMIP